MMGAFCTRLIGAIIWIEWKETMIEISEKTREHRHWPYSPNVAPIWIHKQQWNPHETDQQDKGILVIVNDVLAVLPRLKGNFF